MTDTFVKNSQVVLENWIDKKISCRTTLNTSTVQNVSQRVSNVETCVCCLLNPFTRGTNSDGHPDSFEASNDTQCDRSITSSTHGAAGITEKRRKPAKKTTFIDENAFFLPRTHTSTSHSRVRAQTTPRKQPRTHLHAASQAKRKSCSTSWNARVSPSAPRVPKNSSVDDATAHAVVQERREPQRERRVCLGQKRPEGPRLLRPPPCQLHRRSFGRRAAFNATLQLRVLLECHPCREHTPMWCWLPLRDKCGQPHSPKSTRVCSTPRLVPNSSSGRPHPQERTVKWRVKRKRRNRVTRINCGGMVVMRHQSHPCTRPALRPNRGLCTGAQPQQRQQISELLLCPARSLVSSWFRGGGLAVSTSRQEQRLRRQPDSDHI